MPVCGNSLFGINNVNYIKFGNDSLLAIEGANIAEKMLLSNLRMPYKQLFKAKVILKANQSNYLLNYSGLGDNVTFLAIKAQYNERALEEDNYIIWKNYDNVNYENKMSQFMLLTGNSTNRIPQLFLTNPNPNYSVSLEIMVAIIDDLDSFFNYKPVVYFTELVDSYLTDYNQNLNTSVSDDFFWKTSIPQSPLSLENLVDTLIDKVKDSSGETMSYTYSNFILKDFNGNETYSVSSMGTYSITFDITDDMGYSVDPVDNLQILSFNYNPIVYFTNIVTLDTPDYISPYSTYMGITFGATLSVATWSAIDIINELILEVRDTEGFTMSYNETNIILYNYLGETQSTLTQSGTYSMYFDIQDTFGNFVSSDKNIQILIY